jgi:tRNA A-37 threonylcarbamoyl transferase component Bud32
MNLDNLGKLLKTNDVDINPDRVRKRYRNLAVTFLWGYLERKPYRTARQRYEREKTLIPEFYEAGLNTPEIIGVDDENLTLRWKTLELTDLVQVFEDPRIHYDDKLQYLKEALEQLRGIHNLGETHGDPYFKNFFRLDRDYPKRGSVYTCDFEIERISPDSQVTDILLLVADATKLLNNNHPQEQLATFSALEEVYGRELKIPFDMRDRFFYTHRFGMGKRFFEYFSPNTT